MQTVGKLVIVDAVTSVGGVSLNVDGWGIDAIYSGTQKCLSAPPGLSPVSFSERAVAKIKARIRENTTPRHVPAKIVQVPDIPRTKNGKVVELAVRSVVHGMPVANTDALANPEALALFRDLPELAT